MIREIKFRVWCINRKEWERDAVAISPNGELFDISTMRPMRKDTHITTQFTKLHDKNGKEIYEGDICQDEEGFGVIYWDKDCWRYGFVLFDSSCSSDGEMLREMTNWCEVIGNIYENPELLEAK